MAEEGDGSFEGFYGRRLAAHLGMDGDCLRKINRQGKLALAVTRLTCNRLLRERTAAIPSEQAFSILHQLGDLDRHSCWLAGRQRYSGSFQAGTVSVIDLRDTPQCEFKGPVDAVQYYIPRRALDEFAYENGTKPISTLSWDRGRRDPYLSALSSVLLTALKEENANNSLFIDQLGLSLLAHFAQTYGACAQGRPGKRPCSMAGAPSQSDHARAPLKQLDDRRRRCRMQADSEPLRSLVSAQHGCRSA